MLVSGTHSQTLVLSRDIYRRLLIGSTPEDHGRIQGAESVELLDSSPHLGDRLPKLHPTGFDFLEHDFYGF